VRFSVKYAYFSTLWWIQLKTTLSVVAVSLHVHVALKTFGERVYFQPLLSTPTPVALPFYCVVYAHTSAILIRPPNIVVGGLTFYHDSFSSSFIFRQLPSELAERNSTKTDHILGSECDLKM